MQRIGGSPVVGGEGVRVVPVPDYFFAAIAPGRIFQEAGANQPISAAAANGSRSTRSRPLWWPVAKTKQAD